MIILNLMGGLGNQLFEYAYARALAEEFGDKMIIINPYFSKFYNITAQRTFRMTPNLLVDLKLNSNVQEIACGRGVLYGGYDFLKFAFERIFTSRYFSPEKYIKRSSKGNFQIGDFGISYFAHSTTAPTNKIVTGLYQSEKYFSEIREILLQEFQVKSEPSKENAQMMDEISSCNTIGVHIRKGDYDAPQWSYLNVCDEGYYHRALKYINEHVSNPVFYIFSNTHSDIEWIKRSYYFDQPVKYVDLNNSGVEDLRLMYSCKHFAISNSTLSWWGSYLSKNPNKIVCAPSKWFARTPGRLNAKPYPGRMDIYRDDMIKIPVRLGEEQT